MLAIGNLGKAAVRYLAMLSELTVKRSPLAVNYVYRIFTLE